MSGLDYAAILRGGQALVPDFNQVQGIRAQVEGQRLANEKARADMETALRNTQREEDYYFEAMDVFRNPTVERVASLQARYPDHSKAIQSGWDAMKEGQRADTVTRLGTLYARLRAGDHEGAAAIVREDIEADRRAGAVDDTDLWVLKEIESGDPARIAHIGGYLTIMLSAAVGPDKMGATWGSLREEERQQDEHPAKVAKGQADATIAAAEAAAAPEYYPARARQEAADADIAESDARWRDRENASEVAGRNARTAATRGREDRAASGVPVTARSRSKYVQFARDSKGRRLGFNRKTKKWELVK